MNNIADYIIKILEAIDFADDKETFVKEFDENVKLLAFDNLLKSLPEEHQQSIKSEIFASADNLEKVGEILKANFTEEQTQKVLEDTMQKVASD
ncbi:MAG TPA: hypothetical protein VLG67_04965 [Candidatus Saccharimonadales bacterium]|nr:hypothetical protein [Candidatus Saccharimonadales bacterium]